MRKALIRSLIVLAFGLSPFQAAAAPKAPAGPPLSQAEIIKAFEGKKMSVQPFAESWEADWTLGGNEMDVVANGSNYETFSVSWEGDRMCLGNVPASWTADGCYAVHAKGGAYILWKSGKTPYAKLTP